MALIQRLLRLFAPDDMAADGVPPDLVMTLDDEVGDGMGWDGMGWGFGLSWHSILYGRFHRCVESRAKVMTEDPRDRSQRSSGFFLLFCSFGIRVFEFGDREVLVEE